MLFTITTLNIVLSCYGFYRAYKSRSILLFIWLILAYYSLTSIVSIYSMENVSVSLVSKMTYVRNMSMCIVGFLLADIFFNKGERMKMDFSFLGERQLHKCLIIMEAIYWICLIGTFVELRNFSYSEYNTGAGAGWFQVLFQALSCVQVYFAYRKKWIKVLISAVLLILIVAAVGVRSLLFFTLLPLALYYLHIIQFRVKSFTSFFIHLFPIFLAGIIAVFIVNSLRFGDVRLPETELTTISLSVIESVDYPQTYFNSALHYLAPLLNPIINALNMVGLHLVQPSILLPPSTPIMNAVVTQCVSDASYLENGAHMPATIYHDLFLSWGVWTSIAAFVLYWYWIKFCDFLQKRPVLFFCFSGIITWHLYMLLRGAVDTCTGGIAYSFWVCLILSLVMRKVLSKKIL